MYALIATSAGDELIPPKDDLIAVSTTREKLEDLSKQRAVDRAAWLLAHPLPSWIKCSVIGSEKIVEVPEV